MGRDSAIRETLCKQCHEVVPSGRASLGYSLCIPCAEKSPAKPVRCVVPMNKSNYILVTDVTLLQQLNPKR
jgi:hypothetical protein